MIYCIPDYASLKYNQQISPKKKIKFIGYKLGNDQSVTEDLLTALEMRDFTGNILPDIYEEMAVKDSYPPYLATNKYYTGDRVEYLDKIYEAKNHVPTNNPPLSGSPVTLSPHWKLIGQSYYSMNITLKLQGTLDGQSFTQIALMAQEFTLPENYVPNKAYHKNDIVVFDGNGIKCYKYIAEDFPDWNNTYPFALSMVCHYNDKVYSSLQNNNVNNTPGAYPNYWVLWNAEPNWADFLWLLISTNEANFPLIPVAGDNANPNPFVFYYIVRKTYPIILFQNHIILWKIKIGISQDQSEKFTPHFDSDDLGLSETQTAFMSTICEQNQIIRNIIKSVKG